PRTYHGRVQARPATTLPAALAAGSRASLGGAGALAGFLGIVGTAAASGLSHMWARHDGGVRARHALTLAGAGFTATFISFAVLGEAGLKLFYPLALPFLLTSFIGLGLGAYLFRDVVERQTAETARRESVELRAITPLAPG